MNLSESKRLVVKLLARAGNKKVLDDLKLNPTMWQSCWPGESQTAKILIAVADNKMSYDNLWITCPMGAIDWFISHFRDWGCKEITSWNKNSSQVQINSCCSSRLESYSLPLSDCKDKILRGYVLPILKTGYAIVRLTFPTD
jgi:hypothetical protein